MKKNQNIQISTSYNKILLFVLLLVSCRASLYAQSWTQKDREKVEKFNACHDSKSLFTDKMYFNTIVAVSTEGIIIRDNKTKKERIIKPEYVGWGSVFSSVMLSTVKKTGFTCNRIPQSQLPIVFRPGDTIAIQVCGDAIPEQGIYYTGLTTYGHYVDVDDWYNQSSVLPSSCVKLIVPSEHDFLKRKALYNIKQTNKEFDRLKQEIMKNQRQQ